MLCTCTGRETDRDIQTESSKNKVLCCRYTESSKILQIYILQKRRVFTSRDVVFPDSTKRLESTEIESPPDLPLNLDNDIP
jgi:hypothetical protein